MSAARGGKYIIGCVVLCSIVFCLLLSEGRKEMYLTTYSTHFIHGYMASDII